MASPSLVIRVVENEGTEIRKEMEQSQPQQVLSPHNLRLVDKTLLSTANFVQLLLTGTVLAFQSLSPSFTNQGKCYVSNKYLMAFLLSFCLISCIFFSFTNSLVGRDGKHYYGLTTFKGFYVFKFSDSSNNQADQQVLKDFKKLRIRTVDFVHTFFTSIVFLSVSFSDAGVQSCFFPDEVLVNFPLGVALVSSFAFLILPTTRKGISYTNVTHYS